MWTLPSTTMYCCFVRLQIQKIWIVQTPPEEVNSTTYLFSVVLWTESIFPIDSIGMQFSWRLQPPLTKDMPLQLSTMNNVQYDVKAKANCIILLCAQVYEPVKHYLYFCRPLIISSKTLVLLVCGSLRGIWEVKTYIQVCTNWSFTHDGL